MLLFVALLVGLLFAIFAAVPHPAVPSWLLAVAVIILYVILIILYGSSGSMQFPAN